MRLIYLAAAEEFADRLKETVETAVRKIAMALRMNGVVGVFDVERTIACRQ